MKDAKLVVISLIRIFSLFWRGVEWSFSSE